RGGVTGVVGADVAVVAVERRAADADAAGAGVGRGAGVAVVAHRQGGCAAAAHPGAVTGGGGETRGGAGAGLAGRLELTGGGAAVAGHRVAVVALLTRVEEAVAADRRDLPHEVEGVRLDAAGRQPRPLDAEEVRAARAARDRMQDREVPDVPGG